MTGAAGRRSVGGVTRTSTVRPDAATAARLFEEHRPFLGSLAYRMTGSVADAEDIVQDTFVRALERPPADQDRPWRPWLVRVAINLARDQLRRRRRRGYPGVWLPAPLETGEAAAPDPPAAAAETPAARYDVMESVTLAFLLALEALTPAQRAVLLLRDVFDYSVKETAAALALTQANVKTTHLRARRAMRSYDRDRRPPTRTRQEETRVALERFLQGLAAGDVAAVESLLSAGVRTMGDGGGVHAAAPVPIVGRDKVMRLYLTTAQKLGAVSRFGVRMVNGLPALVMETTDAPAGWAPRVVLQVVLDEAGKIREIHSVTAPGKLTGVAPLD